MTLKWADCLIWDSNRILILSTLWGWYWILVQLNLRKECFAPRRCCTTLYCIKYCVFSFSVSFKPGYSFCESFRALYIKLFIHIWNTFVMKFPLNRIYKLYSPYMHPGKPIICYHLLSFVVSVYVMFSLSTCRYQLILVLSEDNILPSCSR